MSTKISELPSATSLTGAEEIPIVQTGTTKKTTLDDVTPRSIICCKRDEEWINPSSNSYNKVDLELRDCVGTTFSFDTTNHVINVLKNCKALVSATSIIANASGHQTYFRIRKNGAGDIFTIVQNISSSNYLVAFSDILVDLAAGDYLELWY